jgi:UDP-N-acetyl-D-mannosaminuronate dehydrogenase
VVVVTDHDAVDWAMVEEHAPMAVDLRNRLRSEAVTGCLWKL